MAPAADRIAHDAAMEDDEDAASVNDQSSSFFVRALYDFHASDASSLSFRKGALIEVLTRLESGWWDGLLSNDVRGWFPSNYVQRISDEEAEAELQAEQEQYASTGSPANEQVIHTADGRQNEYDFTPTPDSSTQAAEAALLAMQQMQGSGMTLDSQYAGLGLGQDFDALRRLMSGISSSNAATDAAAVDTDQANLAEQFSQSTSLTDSASRHSKSTIGNQSPNHQILASDHLGVSDPRRRSRTSEYSSHLESSLATNSTAHSNFSQTDISSMPARSNAASLSEADGSRKTAMMAVEAAQVVMPSSSRRGDSPDRERGRAQTVSEQRSTGGDPMSHSMLNRPRAQTTHLGPSTASSSASAGSVATGEGVNGSTVVDRSFPRSKRQSSLANGSKRSSREADSFWVPKVNERGEIYYLNTRTSQRSRDLPDGAAFSAARVDVDDEVDDDGNEDYQGSEIEERMQESGTSARSSVRRSSNVHPVQSLIASSSHNRQNSNATGNDTIDSRPSTASSSAYTAATKMSRQNAIDAIPDARDVPWPWAVRTSDDEKTFYLYNRQTHEVCHDVETILSSAQNGSGSSTLRRTSDATNSRDVTSQSARNARSGSASKRGEEEAKVGAAQTALSRYPDEQEALALQQHIMTQVPPTKTLAEMIDEAGDAIATLASIASETIGSNGQSKEDEMFQPDNRNSIEDSCRLSIAITDVVHAIRDLLHASGALSFSSVDMASAAHGMQQFFDGSGASVSTATATSAFQSCVIALQSSNQDTRDMNPYVTAAHSLAVAPTPQMLLPLGKKINATLSKLVLSARSVVEQSCLNAEQRPVFTEAQIEKLLNYRQRIKDDSMELARALGAFGNEASRSRRPTDTAPYSSWMRRNVAELQSAPGVAGVGRTTYGGGAAAGWRGQGFVLPSATEAAALRAEAQGAYQNPFELTREAREAIASGKVALRRKPTWPLSSSLLNKTILPKSSQVDRHLTEMIHLLDESSERSPASTILKATNTILDQCGTLLTLVEEIDFASVIDVDGPAQQAVTQNGSGQTDEYLRSILRARKLLQAFVRVKQALSDGSSLFFLHVQEAVDTYVLRPDNERSLHLDTDTKVVLENIRVVLQKQRSVLMGLLDVIDLQTKLGKQQDGNMSGSTGARAKVYGIDDVKLKLIDERYAQGDVIYLGPGLAIPNGPSAGSMSNTALPSLPTSLLTENLMADNKSAPTASTPSSLKTMFQRGRSATNSSATASGIVFGDGPESGLVRARGRMDGADSVGGGVSTATSLHENASTEGADNGSSVNVASKQVEEVPWFLHPDTPPNDIVLNANGQVKGATLLALMERLTMHNALDSSFNSTFLMTYRSFTTTDELLDLLFARFRIEQPQGLSDEETELWVEKKQRPIRFRVFNVLKAWLETQYHEGENELHMQRIKDFAMGEMVHSPAMSMPANLLLRIIERRSGTGEQVKITMVMPGSAPAPILPKNFRKIKFLDIDPLEMARQLTLMDSRLYNRIRPVECLGQAWNKPNAAELARGIRDVISANNRVSGWVSEAILVQEDVKKRAAWVKQFVAIADRCYALNNFSSMMAISSGLNNASLSRLRRTWDAVNQRHLQLFENIRTIWAPTRNFSKYRETLRKLNPPCVPFLGVYLTDLTFIEEGNSDRMRTDERLINFGKRQMTAEKIQEIMIYQSTPYNLTPVPGIQKFIEENLIEARGEDELFEQSLRLEPREREDEKIARLLQESGFL